MIYDAGKVTLLDFGSAQYLPTPPPLVDVFQSPEMRMTSVFNTTKYFCCQQDLDSQVKSELFANAFDVYSIGCVLYYLLTKEFLKQPLKRVGVQIN